MGSDSADKTPTSHQEIEAPEESTAMSTEEESGSGYDSDSKDSVEAIKGSENTSEISDNDSLEAIKGSENTSEVSDVSDSDLSSSSDEPPRKKKKRTGKRCEVCRKRLTICDQYQCRCGKWFCAPHRYAESHACSFDYKEEGRRIIAEANPVVVAKKIDKI